MAWGNGAIACAKEEPPWPVIRPVANGNAFWIWTPLWLPPIWQGRSGSGTLARPGQPGLRSWAQWALTGKERDHLQNIRKPAVGIHT